MLKRFWPVMTLVILIILWAIILPIIPGMLPNVKNSDYDIQEFHTETIVNFPFSDFPCNVKAGDSFELSGHLDYVEYVLPDGSISNVITDNQGDATSDSIQTVLVPLANQKVRVWISSPYLLQNISTDKSGYFHTIVYVDITPDKRSEVGVGFDGSSSLQKFPGTKEKPLLTVYKYSYESMPEENNLFTISGENSGVSLPVIAAASSSLSVLFLCIIGFFLYRNRKKLPGWLKRLKKWLRRKETASETPMIVKEAGALKAVRAEFTGDPRVEINFPQIEKLLPAVWGIGEMLLISSRVLVDKPEDTAKTGLQVTSAELRVDIMVPDYSPVQVEQVFNIKGQALANVRFGTQPGELIAATRRIRIVDYREEIVELFNGLIDTLAKQGIAVDRKMTAREIEVKIRAKYPEITAETMRDIVKGFEYANYSLQPVARDVYMQMYLAAERIRENLNAEKD